MTLKEQVNQFANSKYHTLNFIYHEVGDEGGTRAYLHSTDEFIDAFYDYIDCAILDKLTDIYCEIVAAWGLDHNSFTLTAYED